MKLEKLNLVCLLFVLLLTSFIFWPSVHFGFVNWDDPYYVTENPLIRELSVHHLKEIFSTTLMGNYQPLVTLSFALEYHWFGLNAGVSHVVNIIFHLMNVALVFGLLTMLKRPLIQVFLAALIFAIHPLRVESVVWITERKDVLFVFFYLLAMIVYLFFRRFSGKLNLYYTVSLLIFVLALLSKPAAVTLPVVLILIDWFENRRFSWESVSSKLPFILLSVFFAVLTAMGYRTPFEYDYLETYTFSAGEHFFMGFMSLLFYMGKMIWPTELVCFYPYPLKANGFLPPVYYAAPLLTFAVFGCLYKIIRDKQIFALGGLWFLITIGTNLAFINFGNVLIADRYTYLPSIGFFLIFTQIFLECLKSFKQLFVKMTVIVSAAILFFSMTLLTVKQISIWRDSETLWSQVIRYYPQETMARYNRGNVYLDQKEYLKAVDDYSVALQVNPRHLSALNNRGNAHLILGNYDQALADYNQAILIDPKNLKIYLNRSEYFRLTGQHEKAIEDMDVIIKQGH